MRCATCANIYHHSTGHMFSESTVLCGVCARNWARWLKSRIARRGPRSPDFYEAAATSVRAERREEGEGDD